MAKDMPNMREVTSGEWAEFLSRFYTYATERDHGDSMISICGNTIIAKVTGYKSEPRRYFIRDTFKPHPSDFRIYPKDESGADVKPAPKPEPERKWYGVSLGDGNNGVSHTHPDYFVKTADPWVLARAAMLAAVSPKLVAWADEAMDLDGDAEYGITVTLYEGPKGETEFGAAWLICEVFPVSDDDMAGSTAPDHESLDDCFGPDILKRARSA